MQQDSFRTSSMRFCANVCAQQGQHSLGQSEEEVDQVEEYIEIFSTGSARLGVEKSS